MAEIHHDLVESFAESIVAHVPLPEVGMEFDLETAYALQHRVTARRTSDRGGVKVGVTNPQAQAYFGLDHALLGSLYGDARLGNGATIPAIPGRALESEFAVLVDHHGRPKAVAPAVEVVFVSFARKTDMTAPNLVLSNLGADLYLVGTFTPWVSTNLDVTTKLKRDGEVVNEASMNEALGGPVEALPWVWSEMQLRGFPAQQETLIMMGACGTVVPADSGSYEADYGAIGNLRFSVS